MDRDTPWNIWFWTCLERGLLDSPKWRAYCPANNWSMGAD